MRQQNKEGYADSFVNDILGSGSLYSESTSVMYDGGEGRLWTPLLEVRRETSGEEGEVKRGGFLTFTTGSPGEFAFNNPKGFFRFLFGYSLIFINFTFIMASILLIMSAVVARENAALRLCARCGNLTIAALVFGVILWVFTIFGFIWIRQRQMLFLLAYVVFLIVLFFALLIIIIFAAVYDRKTRLFIVDPKNFLQSWEEGVNDTFTGKNYDICRLQNLYNCSGFHYGCCVPGKCYNATAPPAWVKKVCPFCPMFPQMSPVVCTDAVYVIVRNNLGGFLVISIFSMVLVVSGILFAFVSRKAMRLAAKTEG